MSGAIEALGELPAVRHDHHHQPVSAIKLDEQVGNLLEYIVSRRVTVPVVDGFESIDVDHSAG